MDSKIVTREIKRLVWPLLKEAGFTRTSGRSMWRHHHSHIDVVNFQSFNSYLAEGLKVTTYSFALNLGCYFVEGPRSRFTKEKNGILLPQEYECHFRTRLEPSADLRYGKDREIWYIDPKGERLKSAVLDAASPLQEKGLLWLSHYREMLRQIRQEQAAGGASVQFFQEFVPIEWPNE